MTKAIIAGLMRPERRVAIYDFQMEKDLNTQKISGGHSSHDLRRNDSQIEDDWKEKDWRDDWSWVFALNSDRY